MNGFAFNKQSDIKKLWIDINNGLKYYDRSSSSWVTVPLAYRT